MKLERMLRVCVCLCCFESVWADLERREGEKEVMVSEKMTRVEEKRAREENKIKNSSRKIHQQQLMTQIFNSYNINTGN